MGRVVCLLLTLGVLVTWGHDAGAATADLLAPRPETLQQLLANALPSPIPLAHAVAAPYYILGPPPMAEVGSHLARQHLRACADRQVPKHSCSDHDGPRPAVA
jgi:hypothetical protein